MVFVFRFQLIPGEKDIRIDILQALESFAFLVLCFFTDGTFPSLFVTQVNRSLNRVTCPDN
jgi:hypothetical protein